MTLREIILETQFVIKGGSLDPHNRYFHRPKTLGLYKDGAEAQEAFIGYVNKYGGSFELRRSDGSVIATGVHYDNGLTRVSVSSGGRNITVGLSDYRQLLNRFYPEEDEE